MADSVEPQVSSTTPLFSDEVHHYQAEPDSELDKPKQDLFSMDDIVDLVGGAQDALERHIAEDGAPHEFTESSFAPPEELVTLPEPVHVTEPVSVPEVKEPEPEVETAIPDSTSFSFVPETPLIALEPEVVAPKVEPESTDIVPEPQVAPEPEPAPKSDALPVAEPRKAAPAPAEAAEQPAVTEEPPAPASYVPSPSKPQPHPLMQFPTALGQKGDSPAPISPLSPLHSPDSLEELSLTESPNQPPTLGSAAPFGSFSTEPPTTHSKDMPWVGEEGDSGPGRSKNKEDLLDPLAGPYLSLGKDPGPHNPCEDSGVSFSPEEKLISSDRSSTGPSPVNPQMMVPESHVASSNPTEHWDSPFLASQDNSKVPMDTFSKDTAPISSSRYEPDLHGNQSDEDDDLMYEVKKNNNPFEGYSPLADSGYSHFGDSKSDSRASKMSESPTPDLVQYGQTGESQDTPPSFLDEGTTSADSLMQSVNQFSSGLKDDDEEEEEEDSALPPSLPDILKSSPLNPDKIDSGSSEGSPEEQSPILERRMMESPNPPINLSANNPFAFDAKVSLLKEMTEEMEVRAADKAKVDDDKNFGAFDLVKEAEETTPTKVKEEEPVKIEQKDWFSSHDSPKMTERFEPLDFQSKKTPADDSDSESPTADSLSPVLEAMAKNPASFQVETEKKDLAMELEEPEVAEEVSEHEVSSEEFEFIERPPRGVIDEFLEALDTSKFASSKPPEIPMDDDLSYVQKDLAPVSAPPLTKVATPPEVEEEAPSQSSYLLLTQASPQKSKAELEKLDIQQPPPQAPLTHSPVQKPEEAVSKKSVEGGKLFKMPNVNIRAVVDLLYWRDVKTTGVVFGAALLLLLSLMVCSIVSVCSYIGLALLSVTICFRIYKGILQAIQKSDEGHPFKQYLDQEVALSEDVVHKYSDMFLAKLNKTISELRRVFLVEDLVDSIKFAVLMWILTYVGALFNGLTLLILGLVGVFSCPIIYEKHQAQIDHYVALVNNQVKDVVGKIQAKVPGMKRKTE
ncbi:reticulon-4a isoform X2 [Enoplosus armatus]|uniref:reticulon-4a isoform X2 n=1 Tax=Enoplosus armatus TaxID=215367 RepID=UPI0039940F64